MNPLLLKIFIVPVLYALLLVLLATIPMLQLEAGKLKLLLLVIIGVSIIAFIIRILILMFKRQFNPIILSSVISIAVAYLGVFWLNTAEKEMKQNITVIAKQYHETCRQQGQCSNLKGLDIPLCQFEKEISERVRHTCTVFGIKFSPSLVLYNNETFLFSYPLFFRTAVSITGGMKEQGIKVEVVH